MYSLWWIVYLFGWFIITNCWWGVLSAFADLEYDWEKSEVIYGQYDQPHNLPVMCKWFHCLLSIIWKPLRVWCHLHLNAHTGSFTVVKTTYPCFLFSVSVVRNLLKIILIIYREEVWTISKVILYREYMNSIRCMKLAAIVSGWRNLTCLFVSQKQVSKVLHCGINAYLFSPDKGSYWVFLTWNNFEFLASKDAILQNDNQSHFKTSICGASLL